MGKTLIEFQDKKIKVLVHRVVNRLDKNIWDILKSRIIGINSEWNNRFGSDIYGMVDWRDKKNTRCYIHFNLFNLRILSKEAVMGVIAHELAHVQDEYGKTCKFRYWLIKYKLLDREKRVDNIAKEWGFEKEINKMRKEIIINTRIIKFKEGYTVDSVENKYMQLSLFCPICKQKYTGEYSYSNIDPIWCSIMIYNQKVLQGKIESRQPMSYEDMIQIGGYCFKCKRSKLIIKKVKPMEGPLEEFTRIFLESNKQ